MSKPVIEAIQHIDGEGAEDPDGATRREQQQLPHEGEASSPDER